MADGPGETMDELDLTLPPRELEVSDVETLLSTLGKAVRAFQIYKANNPVLQRFIEALRDGFEGLWDKTDRLELRVVEKGLRWGDRTFSMGEGRENLAFLFYKDGIRYLTFLPGFEDEMPAFLEVVHRARQLDHDAEDDLITLLWEQDFASFQYGYMDQLVEGLTLPEAEGREPEQVTPTTVQTDAVDRGAERADSGQPVSLVDDEEPVQPLGTVSRDDFEDTLYFLDPSELATLEKEVSLEMERDLHTAVLRALFDRVEDPDEKRQREVLDILDQLLPIFLSRGHLSSAAHVLKELDALKAGDVLGGELSGRVEQLFETLSQPSILEQFVEILEHGQMELDAADLGLFFARLRPKALPVLIRSAQLTEVESVRTRLHAAIDGLAQSHPNEVMALFRAEDPAILRGAAALAGRTGMNQATPALKALLNSHEDADVRLAVARALIAIRSTATLTVLIDALEDDEREVRVAAARGLAAARFASAKERLAALIDSKQVREADLTEMIAFFEAYGIIGGASAVATLDEMLNYKGMLGRRNPAEQRACAALALGKIGTPEARKALQDAGGDEDPVVRNAVNRALRGEDADTAGSA